jgi:hypothetical protein
LFRSNDHFIAPDLVMAEITNAAWKFLLFDGVTAESAQAAVLDSNTRIICDLHSHAR